jgi:PhoPQ-activated pathogenicity-related protein
MFFQASNINDFNFRMRVKTVFLYTETFTDCDIWWHFVGVAIPVNLTYTDAAAMLIDGGSNRYNGE